MLEFNQSINQIIRDEILSVFLCSHWSLVDVPLIFFCPADHVPDWQPRVLLGMVEARSVNVKKTTTTVRVWDRFYAVVELTHLVVKWSAVRNQ